MNNVVKVTSSIRGIIILFFTFLAIAASAQVEEAPETIANSNDSSNTLYVGYLSHDAVLHAMPQYDSIRVQTDSLRRAYEQEMKRVEEEFNKKYENFLEERSQYPRTILLKRQQELQDMLRNNVEFRNRALKDLQEGEQLALRPLRRQLREAVARVARELELMVVVNTDNDNMLYTDPDFSVDITDKVLEALGL